MPMYATPDELVDKWGRVELTRLTATDKLRATDPDVDKMVRGLTDASGVVDGYLRGRYALPLAAPYPAEIVRCVLILARWECAQGGPVTPSEQMGKDREAELRWLRDVADGKVRLDLPAAAAGSPSSLSARLIDRERTFTSGGGLSW